MASFLTFFLFFLGLLGAALGNNNQTNDNPPPKPVVHPSLDEHLGPALFEHLPPTWGDWKGWASGWIPKPCREAAEQHHLNPWEMEVYSVKFTDCDEPWTICRYYNDSSSIAKMVETLGKIPIGMREYASTMMTLPDLGGAVGLTYEREDGAPVIQFLVGWLAETVLVHEISHVLDTQIRREHSKNGWFSNSDWWQGNYSLDTAAVTGYAMHNWKENFAEAAISAVYNLVVPGGLANLTAEAQSVSHVVSTYTSAVGNIIKPRSKPQCTKRWPNHPVVPVSDKKVPSYPPPDVRIKSKNITVIEKVSRDVIGDYILPH
ncbi:hypothetical protein PG984_012458 [Apiospora sp. TS-2023a]